MAKAKRLSKGVARAPCGCTYNESSWVTFCAPCNREQEEIRKRWTEERLAMEKLIPSKQS